MPHIMRGPAAGTARRFATVDTTGRPPKSGADTGATPSSAATVTASGNGTRRRDNGPLNRAMPAHAPTDRRKPTEPTRSGSTRSSAVTATARTRRVEVGRPTSVATSATAAIAEARKTADSQRVSTPKNSNTVKAATKRARRSSRVRTGEARARAKATFCPETARR
jgi:hypothetical protein